jgi:DNA repair exonuclease SbcCD ATPase subunit
MEDKLFYFQPSSQESSLWKNLKPTLSSVIPDWVEKNTNPEAKQIYVPSRSVKLYITLIGGGGSGSLGERRLVNNTLVYARDNNAFNDTTNMLPIPGCGGGGGATIFRLPIILIKQNSTVVNYKVGAGGAGRKNGIGDPMPSKEDFVGKNGEDTSMNIIQFDASGVKVKEFNIKAMGGGGGGAVGYFKSRSDIYNMKSSEISYVWGWDYGFEHQCGEPITYDRLKVNNSRYHWWRIRGSDDPTSPSYSQTTEIKRIAEWYTELFTRRGFAALTFHRELDYPIGSENPIDAAENRNEYIPYNLLTHGVDGILKNNLLKPNDRITLLGETKYAGNPDVLKNFPVSDINGVTTFDVGSYNPDSFNFFYKYAPDDFYYDDTPGIEIDRYMVSTLRNHPRYYFIFGDKWMMKDRSDIYPVDSFLPTDEGGKDKLTVFCEASTQDFTLDKHSTIFKELIDKKLGPIYEVPSEKGQQGAFGGAGGGFIPYYTANPTERHGLYGGSPVRNPWLLPVSGKGGNPYPRNPLSMVTTEDIQDYIYYYGGKGYSDADSNGGNGTISTYFISGSGGGAVEFIHPSHRLSNRKYDGENVDFKETIPVFSESTYTATNESIYQWFVDNYEKICLGGKITYPFRDEDNPISKIYMNDDQGKHKISFEGRDVKDLLKIFGAGGGGGKAFNFTPGNGQENPDMEPEAPGIGCGSGGACSLNEDGEAVVNGLPFGSTDYYLRRMLVYKEYMMYSGFFFESWLGCVLTYFAVMIVIVYTGIGVELLMALLTGGSSVAAKIATKAAEFATKGSLIMSKLALAASKILALIEFIVKIPSNILKGVQSFFSGFFKALWAKLKALPLIGKFFTLIGNKFSSIIAWCRAPGPITAKMAEKGSRLGKFFRGIKMAFKATKWLGKKLLAFLSGDILDLLGMSDEITKFGAKLGGNIATSIFTKGIKTAKGVIDATTEAADAATDIAKGLAKALEEGRKIGMEALGFGTKTADDVAQGIKNALDTNPAKDVNELATNIFEGSFKNAEDLEDVKKVEKFIDDLANLEGANPKTKAKILEIASEKASKMASATKDIVEESVKAGKTATKAGTDLASKVGSEAAKVAQDATSKFTKAAQDLSQTFQKQIDYLDIIVNNASPETLAKMFTNDMKAYVKQLPEQIRNQLMAYMKNAIGSSSFKYFQNAGEMLKNISDQLSDPSFVAAFSNKFLGEMINGIEDVVKQLNEGIELGNKYIAKFSNATDINHSLGKMIANNPAVEDSMKLSDNLKSSVLFVKTTNPDIFKDFDLAKHVADNPSYNKAMNKLIFEGDIKNISRLESFAKSDPRNVTKMVENLKADDNFKTLFLNNPSKFDDLKGVLNNIDDAEDVIGLQKAKLINEYAKPEHMERLIKGMNKGDISRIRQLAIEGTDGSKFLDEFSKWTQNSQFKTVLEDGNIKVFVNDTDVTSIMDELVSARTADNVPNKIDDAMGIKNVDKPPQQSVNLGKQASEAFNDPLLSNKISNMTPDTKSSIRQDMSQKLLSQQTDLADSQKYYDDLIQKAQSEGKDIAELTRRKSKAIGAREEIIEKMNSALSEFDKYNPPSSVKALNNPIVPDAPVSADELNKLGITRDLNENRVAEIFGKGDTQTIKTLSNNAESEKVSLANKITDLDDDVASAQSKLDDAIARKNSTALNQPDALPQSKISQNNQLIKQKQAEIGALQKDLAKKQASFDRYKYVSVEPDGTVKFNDNSVESGFKQTSFNPVDNSSISKPAEVQNASKNSGQLSKESQQKLLQSFGRNLDDNVPFSKKNVATSIVDDTPKPPTKSKNSSQMAESLANKGNAKNISKADLNPANWTPERKQQYLENFKKVQAETQSLNDNIAKLQDDISKLEIDNVNAQHQIDEIAPTNRNAQLAIDAEIEKLNEQIKNLNLQRAELTKLQEGVSTVKDKIDNYLDKFGKRAGPPLEMNVPSKKPNVLRFQVDDLTAIEMTTKSTIRTPISLSDIRAIFNNNLTYYAYLATTKTLFVLNSHYNTDVFSEKIEIKYTEKTGVQKSLNTKIILGPNVSTTTFKKSIVEEILYSKPETLTTERIATYENIYSQLFSSSEKFTKSQIDNQMVEYLMERKKYGLAVDLEYLQNFVIYDNLNIVNKVNYKYLLNNFTDVNSILKSQVSYIIRNPIMFV